MHSNEGSGGGEVGTLPCCRFDLDAPGPDPAESVPMGSRGPGRRRGEKKEGRQADGRLEPAREAGDRARASGVAESEAGEPKAT